MPNPLVSVVIPAFDAERFVAEAIESALTQTYGPVEVIVVDDGSTDETAAVLAGFGDRIRVVRQENRGPSAARNAGFAVSSGEMVAFHDADDIMTADKLAVQVGHLESHGEVGCVVGEQDLFVEPEAKLPYWAEGTQVPVADFRKRDETDLNIHTMTMLVRREVFEAVGGFDETLGHGEDVDWLLRAIDRGVRIARLEGIVVRRRVHAGSITQDPVAGREAMFRVLKMRIERRRAEG